MLYISSLSTTQLTDMDFNIFYESIKATFTKLWNNASVGDMNFNKGGMAPCSALRGVGNPVL